MKIIFLGTGGTYPSKERNVSSVAVQIGRDVVMFDCGEGTQRQLMHSSVSFMRMKAIMVTHLHADHFLGIPGLVQSMSLNGREEPLKIFGPLGTSEAVKSMLTLGYFKSQFDVQPVDLGPGETVEFETFHVKASEASHTVPALIYALEEHPRPGKFDLGKATELGVPSGPLFRSLQEGNAVQTNRGLVAPSQVIGEKRRGRKVVYTGDTRPCEGVHALATDADVLIHDCTFGSEHSTTASEFGHSTAKQAAETAKAANVHRLFLIHFSPRYDDLGTLETEAREIFPNTTAARDLEVVEVPYRNGSDREYGAGE
ncbi:MAG: ribonuclease Z [Thermoplasmata archaeon]